MVAFSEKQQTPRRFEIKRTPARAERTKHDGARRRERLLSRPQRFFALSGAYNDQPLGIEAELGEPRRIRRALFGKHLLFTNPEKPCRAHPACSQTEANAQCGRLRPGPARAKFVQRLTRHSGR